MRDNAYYFALLNRNEQIFYKNIINNLSKHLFKVDGPVLNNHEIDNVIKSVFNDHPELYYVSPRISAGIRGMGSSQLMTLNFVENYRLEQKHIDGEVKKVISNLASLARGKSELEQYMLILDYLVDNVVYEINNTFNQNAASAIYFHKAQCSGISAAYKLLCDALNLYCLSVVSSAKQNGVMTPHAWNIVRINNNYYHVDGTFVIGHNKKGQKPYSYKMAFGSDNYFIQDHVLQPNLPKCLDNSLERLSTLTPGKTELLQELKSFYDIRTLLTKEIKAGNKEISFYFDFNGTNAQLDKMLSDSITMVFTQLQIRPYTASFSVRGKEVVVKLDY